MRPIDMSRPEKFDHGKRGRYTSGCRCAECRRANTLYHRKRQKEVIFHGKNPLVDSGRAREHLLKLAAAGIGRRSVADATDVAHSAISEIKSGRKKLIRQSTETRILAATYDARAGGCLVPAAPTWRQIEELLAEGFTKRLLARRLGSGSMTPTIQLSRRCITAANAMKVDKFYRAIMAE